MHKMTPWYSFHLSLVLLISGWVASQLSMGKERDSCSTSASSTSCSHTGDHRRITVTRVHPRCNYCTVAWHGHTRECAVLCPSTYTKATLCLQTAHRPPNTQDTLHITLSNCATLSFHRLIKKLEHTWKALVHDGVSFQCVVKSGAET